MDAAITPVRRARVLVRQGIPDGFDDQRDAPPAALGRHLALDRKDVTVALDSLAQRGLVERSPDAGDRRRNVVALTDAGRELLPQLDHALESVQVRVLEPLTEREASQLLAMLAKLVDVDAETESRGDGKGSAHR